MVFLVQHERSGSELPFCEELLESKIVRRCKSTLASNSASFLNSSGVDLGFGNVNGMEIEGGKADIS